MATSFMPATFNTGASQNPGGGRGMPGSEISEDPTQKGETLGGDFGKDPASSYHDWAAAMQAYYKTGPSNPPGGYYAAPMAPPHHPYMWGAQPMMAHPYSAAPHGPYSYAGPVYSAHPGMPGASAPGMYGYSAPPTGQQPKPDGSDASAVGFTTAGPSSGTAGGPFATGGMSPSPMGGPSQMAGGMMSSGSGGSGVPSASATAPPMPGATSGSLSTSSFASPSAGVMSQTGLQHQQPSNSDQLMAGGGAGSQQQYGFSHAAPPVQGAGGAKDPEGKETGSAVTGGSSGAGRRKRGFQSQRDMGTAPMMPGASPSSALQQQPPSLSEALPYGAAPQADMWGGAGSVARGRADVPEMTAAMAYQDEREVKRQRRKQSNRESARRSRLRKQAECEELSGRVNALSMENMSLRAELGKLQESLSSLVNLNAKLRSQVKALALDKGNGGEQQGQEVPMSVEELPGGHLPMLQQGAIIEQQQTHKQQQQQQQDMVDLHKGGGVEMGEEGGRGEQVFEQPYGEEERMVALVVGGEDDEPLAEAPEVASVTQQGVVGEGTEADAAKEEGGDEEGEGVQELADLAMADAGMGEAHAGDGSADGETDSKGDASQREIGEQIGGELRIYETQEEIEGGAPSTTGAVDASADGSAALPEVPELVVEGAAGAYAKDAEEITPEEHPAVEVGYEVSGQAASAFVEEAAGHPAEAEAEPPAGEAGGVAGGAVGEGLAL